MADPWLMTSQQTYENNRREDNWRFNQYRTTGRLPRFDDRNQVFANAFGTPFQRAPGTQAPTLGAISQVAPNQVRGRFAARPPAQPPNAADQADQNALLLTTKSYFQRPPRYRFRRSLGQGGQGTAYKVTYRSPNNNDLEIDFALKVSNKISGIDENLRAEARMMEVG